MNCDNEKAEGGNTAPCGDKADESPALSVLATALATILNGREYGREITKEEAAQAKDAGLLVVFGASDDLLEFRGAFDDEVGAYNGTTCLIHPTGVMPSWEGLDKDDEEDAERYFQMKREAKTRIDAAFNVDGYTWIISATVPHATFEIMDDGEKYCRGLVLSMKGQA